MRYQVVVLESDINSAILIESISWIRAVGGEPHAFFEDMAIYMGSTEIDELTLVYEDNYTPGTRTLVLDAPPSYAVEALNPNDWFTITLDTPYWYDGVNNLIIEIEWSSGLGSLYTWHWDSGSPRKVIGAYGASSGDYVDSTVPNIKLNGTLSLEDSTWSSIKSSL